MPFEHKPNQRYLVAICVLVKNVSHCKTIIYVHYFETKEDENEKNNLNNR